MSMGGGCRVKAHRPAWRVAVYRANFSAFNGYHKTPSDYSEIVCTHSDHNGRPALDHDMGGTRWRTKAAYVDTLPHLGEADTYPTAVTDTVADHTQPRTGARHG